MNVVLVTSFHRDTPTDKMFPSNTTFYITTKKYLQLHALKYYVYKIQSSDHIQQFKKHNVFFFFNPLLSLFLAVKRIMNQKFYNR